MTEKPASIMALLSTPVAVSLGDARKELQSNSPPQSNISLQEFTRELRYAVSLGDSDTVHKLLRGTKYRLAELAIEPPLTCVAASKGYGDIVGLLIRHGADVNASSVDGSTALICAADNGYLNVMALLLNAGAQMNLLNRNGETALARATRRGWVKCARLLLTYGANPHPMATDSHSMVVSPLHLARQMYQPTIEQDIMARAMSMEHQMLEVVRATLPKHVCLLEPGHLVDTRTSSFFPLQLISDEELNRFVLYFKTPPGFDRVDRDGVGRHDNHGPSDELILVYLVRVHLSDGQPTCWLTGPCFSAVSLSFNGTKRNSTRLPVASDYPGLCVFSVSTAIKTGGLNTLCLETPTAQMPTKTTSTHRSKSSVPTHHNFPMTLIGAYRIRIDVTSLVQASAGLALGGASSKATIYIPRSLNL